MNAACRLIGRLRAAAASVRGTQDRVAPRSVHGAPDRAAPRSVHGAAGRLAAQVARLSPGRRRLVAGVAAAALLASTGVIVWRVLRPSEVVTVAASYPDSVAPVAGQVGSLVSAPLIIDSRIRVFANKREVWSDAPPSYHYERSALWSYRRWPAQVTGVVLAPGPQPIVVSAWSDGMLIGTDARTGKVAWRVQGDKLAEEFTGRRTGANVVYNPPGLFTTGSTIVTSSPSLMRGFDSEGTQIWSRPPQVSPECRGTEFTSDRQFFALDTCAQSLRRLDTTTGQDLPAVSAAAPAAPGTASPAAPGGAGPITAVEPVSCAVGNSRCAGMRTHGTADTGWRLDGPEPDTAPALEQPGALIVDGIVVVPDSADLATKVTAHDPVSGEVLWTWNALTPARLLAGDQDRIFLLTPDQLLLTLSPRSGLELSRAQINIVYEQPNQVFDVNHIYTVDRYVVMERVNPNVPESAPDDEYYFSNRPVLVAIG